MQDSIAGTTAHTYERCLESYINWARRLDLRPMPLHEQNLILFTTELALKTSYSSIKSHLAAVKFFSQIHGYNSTFNEFVRLYRLVRGIRRKQGSSFKKPKRTPVTPEMLHLIKINMFNSSIKYNDKLMLWAAMLTAFYGFLRVSEYASARVKSYEPETTLSFKDFTVTGNMYSIVIKASKTDPFRTGATVRIAPNNSELCPVMAIHQFRAVHPSKRGPMFTFQDGKYLTRSEMSKTLKRFLPHASETLSSHSFRIGAATTAARMGHPRWLIQSMGRWTSDCFRDYIRIPDETIAKVSSSMLHQTVTTEGFDPDLF